jgi:hypothetical protein
MTKLAQSHKGSHLKPSESIASFHRRPLSVLSFWDHLRDVSVRQHASCVIRLSVRAPARPHDCERAHLPSPAHCETTASWHMQASHCSGSCKAARMVHVRAMFHQPPTLSHAPVRRVRLGVGLTTDTLPPLMCDAPSLVVNGDCSRSSPNGRFWGCESTSAKCLL